MKPTRHISMMEQCSMKYTATDKTAKEKTKSKNIKTRVIPGYHLSLGIVVTMLSVIVLIPLASVLVYSLKISPGDFVALIMKENVRNAFITSITSSFIAAIVNVVFGLIVAWTLVKYDFPGNAYKNKCHNYSCLCVRHIYSKLAKAFTQKACA